MKSVNIDHYTYRVEWSPEDEEFAASVAEFPSISWLEPTQEQALKGLRDALADIVADMESNGEEVPQPLSERAYSGNIVLRIPPSRHRKLAIQAAEEHVSLNRLMSDRLAV